MGHRASVAYVTSDGIATRYSHWGALDARLAFGGDHRITPTTPYGDGDVDLEEDPYWEGESLTEWAEEAINFLHHECAYTVDATRACEVRAFDTLWWKGENPGGPSEWNHSGVLVELHSADEWCQFAHDDDLPDNTLPREEWLDGVYAALKKAGALDRIPDFTPMDPR